MRRLVVALVLAMLTAQSAAGGAWTVKRHHWQAFSATIESSASVGFDNHGKRSVSTSFGKVLVQNWIEYGATGWLTLFVVPNYVTAHVQTPFAPLTRAANFSFEGGARVLLSGKGGKWSLQTSYKTAGPFDLSVSNGVDAGRQFEARLLYGTSFKVVGHDGFFDAQVAQRWIAHPRPNETVLDLTAGLWLNKRWMLMAQSFNTISGGDAQPPFAYYRSHKLELSLVEKVDKRWSLQVGAFFSPAGQNALVERGVQVSLWRQE
jgi:hypothetical protein